MNAIDFTDGREPEHGSSATAAACEAAALFGATPGPDEFDNRPLWEAEPRMKTRPHGDLTPAEQRTRRWEQPVRSDQDPNLQPGDPIDIPDLQAAFAASHLPGILHEIIDLCAEHLCPDGTRLADERDSLLWGLVNAFDAQVRRLDRNIDKLTPEMRDLARAQDGTEIKSRELELLTDRARSLGDRRDAFEIYRDCAAEAYCARTGEVWRPRHGSHTSLTGSLTSAAIDARDFRRARSDRKAQAHLPQGTLVATTGGKQVTDPGAVLAQLDKVRAKYPDMVLLHGGGPGVEKIAARWAERNAVDQVICKPDWNRHGKAAPFRRNDELLNLLPKGVIAFPGSGITDNLVDKARQLGIPVHKVTA